MKIEIEIDDETAACIWENRTWTGHHDKTVAELVQILAEREAEFYRRTFPACVPHSIELFRLSQMARYPASQS